MNLADDSSIDDAEEPELSEELAEAPELDPEDAVDSTERRLRMALGRIKKIERVLRARTPDSSVVPETPPDERPAFVNRLATREEVREVGEWARLRAQGHDAETVEALQAYARGAGRVVDSALMADPVVRSILAAGREQMVTPPESSAPAPAHSARPTDHRDLHLRALEAARKRREFL